MRVIPSQNCASKVTTFDVLRYFFVVSTLSSVELCCFIARCWLTAEVGCPDNEGYIQNLGSEPLHTRRTTQYVVRVRSRSRSHDSDSSCVV